MNIFIILIVSVATGSVRNAGLFYIVLYHDTGDHYGGHNWRQHFLAKGTVGWLCGITFSKEHKRQSNTDHGCFLFSTSS